MLKKITLALCATFPLSVNAVYISPLIYKDVSCIDLAEELKGHKANHSENDYNAALADVNMRPRSMLPVYIKEVETSAAHIKAIKSAAKKIQCDLTTKNE